MPLELVVCVECGKVDLFAKDVARLLTKVGYELVEAGGVDPYR